MKTIFRSHELWDLVENEFALPEKKDEDLSADEKKLLRENIVKDTRALGIIHGVVSDQMFPRMPIKKLLRLLGTSLSKSSMVINSEVSQASRTHA